MVSGRTLRTPSPSRGRCQRFAQSGLRRSAVGVVCGLFIAFSIPPFGLWPLAWVGFAGVASLLPGCSAGERAALGLGAGLGQYIPGLVWVSEFSIPGCVALMLLSALFVSAGLVLVQSQRPVYIAIGLPASFILTDWLRSRFPLGGFPLGGVSLGQALSPLVPASRLGGSLLLTGETALLGVAIATASGLVLSRLNAKTTGRDRNGWMDAPKATILIVSSILAVAIPLGGLVSPSGAGGKLGTLRAALVQGGGPRGTRAIHTDPDIVFQRHVAAAKDIRPPVDLVVMPEGILQTSVELRDDPSAYEVAAIAEGLHGTVICGVEQDVGTNHYLNEVVTWSPSGEIVARYLKNHRVPFGEYVPWRSVISRFFNVADVPLDAVAGHKPGYMHTPAGPVGVMISYEVFFDERARGGVRAGGQVLVVPTNTASYRSSQVPAQELAAARIRAWETGRWVLQVTPTGYSAVISPSGSLEARSTLGQQSVLQAAVQRRSGRTIYVMLGDTPFAVAGGLLLISCMALARRARLPSEVPGTTPERPGAGR